LQLAARRARLSPLCERLSHAQFPLPYCSFPCREAPLTTSHLPLTSSPSPTHHPHLRCVAHPFAPLASHIRSSGLLLLLGS
jgi:hypothetical protein